MRIPSVFLLAFVLLSGTLLGQPSGASNTVDAKGRKQGPWTKTWPNGKLRYLGQFANDKPVGEFKHYDELGALTTEQRYDADGRISRARHYHPNGQVMAMGKYIGQDKDSTWNFFDGDGKLRQVERYQLGKLHGERLTYYPGGALLSRENFEQGQQQGESRSWYANGKTKLEVNYVNDAPEGIMIFYHPEGTKEAEGRVLNGLREGTWMEFAPDGTLRLQTLYRGGSVMKEKRENGTFQDHYEDGQLRTEVTYVKGLRQGRFVEYRNNGRWVIKPVPPDPVTGTQADQEMVLEGQTMAREGTYANDHLDGDVKEYDERGRLVRTVRYSAGEVVGNK